MWGAGVRAIVEVLRKLGRGWGFEKFVGCSYNGGMFHTLPTALKVLIVAGVLMVGPVMVMSFLLWGTNGGIGAVLFILLYFMVIYIVGVRRFMK
jgi:hypothetical protein